MSSHAPEWEHNSDAKECRLCLKLFSFRHRRHHCRSCGRVVCNPCSTKRLILNQNDNNDNKPSRVCDDCYGSLTTRKAFQEKGKIKREKAQSLLQMSSVISDTLLRVFLLDGSFKVVSYDDSTTASELTSNVCYSVNCALFETIDITNTDHLKMIPYNEAIIDILARWNIQNVTNAKFIIPVYDIESCGKAATFRIVKANPNKDLVPVLVPDDIVGTPVRKDNAQSPSRTGRILNKILKGDKSNTTNTTNTLNDGNDVDTLKMKLVEITEKYEMASSILAKRGIIDSNVSLPSSSSSSSSAYNTPTKIRGSITSTTSSTLYKKPISSSAKTIDTQSLHDSIETSPYKSLETLKILGRDDIIIATTTNDLSLLLRTFFYQLNGIENFCSRYENILKSIITGAVSSNAFDNVDDRDSDNITLESIIKNPQIFAQVYEMASALESLYELLQKFSISFNFNVKRWLLDSFRSTLSLRDTNIDMISSILHCLDREKILMGDEVGRIITTFIDECFYGSILLTAGEYTTPEILAMLERMLLLLQLISDDLIHVLPGYDLMQMYEGITSSSSSSSSSLSSLSSWLLLFLITIIPLSSLSSERFFKVLRDDITTFYFTNRQQICFNDLLQILAFVESIDRKFESISIDTAMIKELVSDIMKKLTAVSQTNTQLLLATLHENDEKSIPIVMDTSPDASNAFNGLGSRWPQQMINHLEEVLKTVSRLLQSPSREKIYLCILNTLPQFITQQSNLLKKIEVGTYSRDVSIERLCAYMNNHFYFSQMLEECQHGLLSKSELEEDVGQCFSSIRLLYTVSPALSANILSQICTSDIKDILKAGLFKSGYESSVGSQFGGSKVVTIVATALNKHKSDLLVYLCQENQQKFYKTLMTDMLFALTETFLELLLLTVTSVNPNLLLKIDEDYNIISSLCLQYKDCFKDNRQENIILLPLRDVVVLLQLDTRQMASFVRENLFIDFGMNAVRIWQTMMTIRGESKLTVDTVYDSIMRGWTPADDVTPLNTCKFKDKLRKK